MAVMTRDEFVQKYKRMPSSAPLTEPQNTGGGIGGAAQDVSNFFGAKGLTDLAGSQIAKLGLAASGNMDAANKVQQPSLKNVVGSAVQTGANFIPGVGVGAGIGTKLAVGAATGYAFDVGSKLQNNTPSPFSPGVGTAIGAALPVAASVTKPAVAIMGRLLKGLGSGVSGVSADTIGKMVDNPQFAQRASQKIAQIGGTGVIKDNAKTIVNGVSKIRQEARAAFGKGLEGLKATDINPTAFRDSIQPILEKHGSSQAGGVRTLANIEFDDPKNIAKASGLIDRLSSTEMDGGSLRKLADDIENAKYKTATSDERLSFNAFLKDLSGGVKNAINTSTDKLKDINGQFHSDMELADTVQDIFGDVDFKNLPEVARAARKLEGLFTQKGIDPEVVDNFLKRIGVNPDEFRTTEAVRQIENKSAGANTIGLTPSEVSRGATAALVTPDIVKKLSIATGIAKETLQPFLQSLKPAARAILIQALEQNNQNSSTQPQAGVPQPLSQ